MFAALIWAADEPCSVKTAWAPESSFTRLCLCTSVILGSNSAFLRWHMSINAARWRLLLALCASRLTSLLLLTFAKSHAGIVSSYFHSLSTAAFASCYINVFQWNRECFFLRHVELNSRFIMVTTDKVTLDRPKIVTGSASSVGSDGWGPSGSSSRSRVALKFSVEIFPPYGRLPPQSGFSDFVVSSWQFCCTICCWEYEFITFFVLSIHPSRWFFEDKFLMRPTFPNLQGLQPIRHPSKILTAYRAYPRNNPGKTFFPKLMDSWLVFRRNRVILNQWTKRNDRSFEWCPKIVFRTEFSRLSGGLGHVAGSNSIP